MILLFGDSWARQSWSQSRENLNNGYKHWAYDNVWVNNNVDDWLNHYFTGRTVINFAEYGNTNNGIIKDLHSRSDMMSNWPERVDFVVFQTDPLRIFAPRQDYTQKDIVWPNFMQWCQEQQFDWQSQGLDELLVHIYNQFYQKLNFFAESTQKFHEHCDVRLWVLGGVSKVDQSMLIKYRIPCIMPSITEHFGLQEDSCLENRLSFISFMNFWMSELPDSQAQKIKHQWQQHDTVLEAKDTFWTSRPDIFAGRHLTSAGLQSVAQAIQKTLDQA